MWPVSASASEPKEQRSPCRGASGLDRAGARRARLYVTFGLWPATCAGLRRPGGLSLSAEAGSAPCRAARKEGDGVGWRCSTLSAQIIGRGTGRSAVAAAAYRSGGRLVDAGSGMAFDYTRKTGVIHSAVLLPAGAPDRLADRELLWNEVEGSERRKDAQLAREIELALPRELPDADNIELVRAYVQEQFVARGMIADLNVHKPVVPDGLPRPHAHVLLTMRTVSEAGFGPKERSWNGADLLHDWREALAVRINQALAEHGHEQRVDHRSYQERGIGLEPQSKIGAPGRRERGGGLVQQRTAAHRALAARNGERLAADPGIALELLTEHSASFTRRDLARLVATHSDGAEQFTRVMARVEASPLLVRLGVDGRGEERFTSASMWAAERRLREHAAGLGARRTHWRRRGAWHTCRGCGRAEPGAGEGGGARHGCRRPGAGGGLCRDRQEPDAGGGTRGLGGGGLPGAWGRLVGHCGRGSGGRLGHQEPYLGLARACLGAGARASAAGRRPGDRRGRDGGHAADGAGAGPCGGGRCQGGAGGRSGAAAVDRCRGLVPGPGGAARECHALAGAAAAGRVAARGDGGAGDRAARKQPSCATRRRA